MSLKKCPITGIDDTRILIASHIKPWTMSDNSERLDLRNGFLFSPTFNRLLDRGIITFSDKKELIVSSTLSKDTLGRLRIFENQIIEDLPIIGRVTYLEYHRTKIFQHN